MSALETEIPEICRQAREAFALSLADPNAPVDVAATAHLAGCEECKRATGRIRKLWELSGEARQQLFAEADADALYEGTLARAREQERESLAARRAGRRGFGWGLAVAAGLVVLALAPRILAPPPPPVAVASPTATPALATAEPPDVTLLNAKGEVSVVPADGSTLEAPKSGARLPPGLFSASNGAALTVEGAGLLAVRGDTALVIGGVKGNPELAIARGEVYVDLPKGTIHTFVVRTPAGSVHVTGTAFDVKAGAKTTTVKVTRGSVKVVSPAGETAVAEGESATVARDAAPASGLISAPGEDFGWVKELAPDRAPATIGALAENGHHPREMKVAQSEAGKTVHLPGLDKTIIDDAMQKRQDALRWCYDVALRADPTLSVHAVFSFRVDDHGVPEGLSIRGLKAGQDELRDCFSEAAKKAVFPPTVKGTEVDVTYPIDFVPPAPTPERPR